jgi:septal ring factor EnvC (AmiA/AmiB activator)
MKSIEERVTACEEMLGLCDAQPAPVDADAQLREAQHVIDQQSQQLATASDEITRLTRHLAAMTRNRDLHRQCRMDSDAEVARLRGLIDDAAKRAGEIARGD